MRRVSVLSFGGGATYYKRILGMEAANLIGYWPLNEGSGSVADNLEGTAARDGAYSGVTLGQEGMGDGWTAPLFDGANDYCRLYSASFAGVFDGAEGSAMLWCRVANVGCWTDGQPRFAFDLYADSNNYIRMFKQTNANVFECSYEAGGTLDNWQASVSTTEWFCVAMSWSAAADQVVYCVNGATTVDTGLGTWAGSLNSGYTALGVQRWSPTVLLPWSGWLAHAAVWTKPLTAAQMLSLGTL